MASSSDTRLTAKNIIRPAAVTILLLSVPFMAMVFDWKVYDPGNPLPERVNWTLFDFIVMGMLLMSTGLVYEFLAKRVSTRTQKIILGFVLLSVLLLFWAELAVGLFGAPLAGS